VLHSITVGFEFNFALATAAETAQVWLALGTLI
jgi:hypothetical protein